MRLGAEEIRRLSGVGSAAIATPTIVEDTVSVAPSPADSGLTLTPVSTTGFPDPVTDGAFDVLCYAPDIVPSADAVEILHVTDLTTGVWTFERQQYGSPALSIATGWLLKWTDDAMALDLRAYLEGVALAPVLPAIGAIDAAITTEMVFSAGNYYTAQTTGAGGGDVNSAFLAYAVVMRTFPVASITFAIATSTGNIDVGIYDDSFQRLWSRGSIASPGTGLQTINISAGSPTTLTLSPGIHWLALGASSDTLSVNGNGSDGTIPGTGYHKTSSFPLPSSISSPTSNTTAELTPWMRLNQ